MLFLLSACSIVANVVGSKVSYAILRDALSENSKSIAESFNDGGDKVQTTYPVGSEIRRALSTHWGYAHNGSAYVPSPSLLLDLQLLSSGETTI